MFFCDLDVVEFYFEFYWPLQRPEVSTVYYLLYYLYYIHFNTLYEAYKDSQRIMYYNIYKYTVRIAIINNRYNWYVPSCF